MFSTIQEGLFFGMFSTIQEGLHFTADSSIDSHKQRENIIHVTNEP